MKKIIIAFFCTALLTACGHSQKWEYKVVKMAGKESTMKDFTPMTFDDPSETLNKMGKEGWELVDTYTEINTVHPNFGNEEYVTGIRENTRTAILNFVFKRPAQGKQE